MVEFLIFGGTTEGRDLARFLDEQGRSAMVCVATEYGASLAVSRGDVTFQVKTGRMDADRMQQLLREQQPRLVIDATHPYADEAKRNIRTACEAMGVPCWRVRREPETEEADGILTFPTMEAILLWLNRNPGVVFSTLGAKEAAALGTIRGAEERLWLRVLPMEESLRRVREAKLPARHIIAMQGPFSQALNEAMFRETKADILLTKDSGKVGGFAEKCRAARACGMTVLVLARPEEIGVYLTLDEIKSHLREGIL